MRSKWRQPIAAELSYHLVFRAVQVVLFQVVQAVLFQVVLRWNLFFNYVDNATTNNIIMQPLNSETVKQPTDDKKNLIWFQKKVDVVPEKIN